MVGCGSLQFKVELKETHFKKKKKKNVILKSKKKLASWKTQFLSRVDKIVLIKANFASSPLHVMNCFKLTKRNSVDLDRINKNFL